MVFSCRVRLNHNAQVGVQPLKSVCCLSALLPALKLANSARFAQLAVLAACISTKILLSLSTHLHLPASTARAPRVLVVNYAYLGNENKREYSGNGFALISSVTDILYLVVPPQGI